MDGYIHAISAFQFHDLVDVMLQDVMSDPQFVHSVGSSAPSTPTEGKS